MKYLLTVFLLFSAPAFAGDFSVNSYDADFERREIRLHRDRGETKDYGGYWMDPTPTYRSYNNEVERDEHRESMNSSTIRQNPLY